MIELRRYCFVPLRNDGSRVMEGGKELLAYCGFYCGDCLGYTGVIAGAAQNFLQVLETYRFDRTAERVFPEQLRDYGKLREVLGFMTDLRCPGVCRQGVADSGTSARSRIAAWRRASRPATSAMISSRAPHSARSMRAFTRSPA